MDFQFCDPVSTVRCDMLLEDGCVVYVNTRSMSATALDASGWEMQKSHDVTVPLQ